jgi:predicted DNA binding CopG/RHH family protein
VKRIIGGKSYNTDTATEVFSESASEPSMGWWALYQTRHGAFFKLVVDHDGETMSLTPLSDADAQALLEKRANHLLEQYFGPFPEDVATERRLTIRVPGNLADRIETTAKAKGLSLNTVAMRCFEQYADAADAPRVLRPRCLLWIERKENPTLGRAVTSPKRSANISVECTGRR